ncbi:unnamed protein product, partial [Ectocarpus sp. 12 AP-2014]
KNLKRLSSPTRFSTTHTPAAEPRDELGESHAHWALSLGCCLPQAALSAAAAESGRRSQVFVFCSSGSSDRAGPRTAASPPPSSPKGFFFSRPHASCCCCRPATSCMESPRWSRG